VALRHHVGGIGRGAVSQRAISDRAEISAQAFYCPRRASVERERSRMREKERREWTAESQVRPLA
jgi:hypothetical protein